MNNFISKLLFTVESKKISENRSEFYLRGRFGNLSFILYDIFERLMGIK